MPLGQLILCLTLALPVGSDSVWQALRQRYLGLVTLSGEFTETITPPGSDSGSTFRGTFAVRLPSDYRLEVKTPQRQLIVGNDSSLWFFLPSEKRAVHQPAGQSIPLLVFLEPLLDSTSSVTVLPDSTGPLRLSVTTSDPMASFSDFIFTLDQKNQRITAFSFTDAWNSSYRFTLSRQSWNPKLANRVCGFTPPAGTRVE
jgi:outer membrane lipoprotein-sorting protein